MKSTGTFLHATKYCWHWFTKPTSFLAIILISLGLPSGCKQEPANKYDLIKAYGNGKIANLTKSFIFYSNTCSLVSPGAFMASDGDLLMIEDWAIPYSSKNYPAGQPIRFITSDSVLLINNKVVGLCLDSNYRMEGMLRNIDSISVLDLQVLSLSASSFLSYQKHLQSIAAINPNIAIQIADSIGEKDFSNLLSMFNPTCLFAYVSQSQFALLQAEEQLINLYINLCNETTLLQQSLPALKNLKTLSLNYDHEGTLMLTANALKNNPQIERLTLANFDSASVQGFLEPLQHLKEFIATDAPFSAKELLAHQTTLERVLVDSFELQLQMPHLRWASIGNDETSTIQLDSLAKHFPNLEVLEIFGDGNRMEVTALQEFKHLTALTMVDADSIDLKPVKEMQQLKLLSYSMDEGNEDSTIAVLKASLPNTLVVPNEGFCVGSGWLLLLLPAMLIAVMWANRTSRKRSASVHK